MFEIRIIELGKVKREYEKNNTNPKLQWLMFLNNPNDKEVQEIMEENDGVKEAVVKVRKMSEDEKMERLAFLREKAIMDEKSIYSAGKNDDKKEGAKGEKIKIAKFMILEGIDINIISKVTELPIDEINKLYVKK